MLKADQQQRHRSTVAVNVQEKLSQFERVRNLARLAQLGDYTAALGWRDMLVGTLKRNGYCLAPELQGSEGERTMLVEYASAYGEALDTLEARYTGNLRCISGHKESSDNEVADGYEDETILVNLAEKNARLAQLDYGVVLPAPVTALAPALHSA